MQRLFGKAKEKAPPPSLDDVGGNIDVRVGNLDGKIKQLETEMVGYNTRLKTLRPGPAQRNLKARMMTILKQKRMYETQRDQLYGQRFNLDQASFAIENVKESAQVVEGMKAANVALKMAHKNVSLDEVEDMQDDLEDMLEEADEIQQIMSRSYGLPDDCDEEAL